MNKDFVKNIIKKLDLEHNKPNANLIDNNLLLTLDSYSINIISDLLFTSETKTIDDLINENMGFIIDDFLHITMYDNIFYILFYTKKQLDLIIKSNPNLNNIQDFIDLSDNFFKRAFTDKYDHQDLQYPIHYAFLTSLGYEFFSLDNKFIFNNLEKIKSLSDINESLTINFDDYIEMIKLFQEHSKFYQPPHYHTLKVFLINSLNLNSTSYYSDFFNIFLKLFTNDIDYISEEEKRDLFFGVCKKIHSLRFDIFKSNDEVYTEKICSLLSIFSFDLDEININSDNKNIDRGLPDDVIKKLPLKFFLTNDGLNFHSYDFIDVFFKNFNTKLIHKFSCLLNNFNTDSLLSYLNSKGNSSLDIVNLLDWIKFKGVHYNFKNDKNSFMHNNEIKNSTILEIMLSKNIDNVCNIFDDFHEYYSNIYSNIDENGVIEYFDYFSQNDLGFILNKILINRSNRNPVIGNVFFYSYKDGIQFLSLFNKIKKFHLSINQISTIEYLTEIYNLSNDFFNDRHSFYIESEYEKMNCILPEIIDNEFISNDFLYSYLTGALLVNNSFIPIYHNTIRDMIENNYPKDRIDSIFNSINFYNQTKKTDDKPIKKKKIF